MKLPGLLLLMFVILPLTASAQTDSVRVYVERQDFQSAIRLLDSVLTQDPENPELRYRLAQVTAWSGAYPSAIAILRKLVADIPSYSEAVVLLARVHSWNADYNQAETLYRSIVKEDPAYGDAQAGLAQLAFYKGALNEAYVLSNSVLVDFPENEVALQVRNSIQKGMRPESETQWMMPWDSEGNRGWVVSESVGFALRPGLGAFVKLRAVDNGASVFSWTGGARWSRYSASLGANAYRQTRRIDLEFSGSARFANSVIFANRYGLFDSQALIDRNVSITEIGGIHLYRRATQTLTSTSTFAAYSTGNQRIAVSLDYDKSFVLGEVTFRPGAVTSVSSFLKNDPTGGFFAPKWWNVSALKAATNYRPATSRFHASLTAQLGAQTIAPYGAERIGPDLSYSFDLSAGYTPSQDLQIVAGYLYSTLLNTTSQANDSYWAQRLGIRVFIRF